MKLLDREEVVDLVGLSGVIILQYLIERHGFPSARRIEKGRYRWLLSEVMNWLESNPSHPFAGKTYSEVLATVRLESSDRPDKYAYLFSRDECKAWLGRQCGMICPGCGRTFDHLAYFHIDHKEPVAKGGSHNLENLQLLCAPCNIRKGSKMTMEELVDHNLQSGFHVTTSKLHK